ncbi:unnamed protein product, partial [Ixodes pacificus]
MAYNFLEGEWFVQSLGCRVRLLSYRLFTKPELVIGGFFQTFEKNVTFVMVK